MKRILKVTGIVVIGALSVIFLACTALCIGMAKDDEYIPDYH